ncbi:MAG: phosphonate C-P lyase system protein PhnH, partial [Acetobacteraceae bacterium]|nr:phosphonate C-P lyase system protein PhnH [Acetobacteraceae bacterium]
ARPGKIVTLQCPSAPPPLATATAALLLTLADHDTPVWLDPGAAAACDWVAFHCGAAIVANPMRCAFAVALSFPGLVSLPAGTHEAPETAATLILQVKALGSGTRFRLSGPGVRNSVLLAVNGLPTDFAGHWQHNHALFPRGVDVLLCAGERLAALPRSVALEDA